MLNIAMTKAKQDLLVEKTKMCIHAQLQTYNIIPHVNVSWEQSFAWVDKNKNAIADWGCNPLNRNLLLFPKIRAIMTEEEVYSEASSNNMMVPYTIANPSTLSNNTMVPHIDTTTTTAITAIANITPPSIDEPKVPQDWWPYAFC